MFKLVRLALLIGIGFGVWYFFTHFRVCGLESIKIQPRSPQEATAAAATSFAPFAPQPAKKTIRIAAANFGPLDQAKLAKAQVLGRVVQILRQFDLVALQDIQARDRGLLVQLIEQTNTGGRHYDFAVAPQVGREPTQQYNAFVFDADAIEIDRRTVAWVDNRGGQFAHSPLVAAFRAHGPAPNEAFTFTLINVQTSSERTAEELALLAKVFRAVRDDGRNEDDVIILGTLGTDEEHLGSLGLLPNACCAISATPTTPRGTRAVDNLIFDRRATGEYTHRSGVIDLMRQFNLAPGEAAEMAGHLPVWAEFSVYEGGLPGQVAGP
jgi:hypothetical protein